MLFFIICFLACMGGAISGVGGGVIIKPVVDAVTTFSAVQVSFLSGCTVLAMTTVTLLRSRKATVGFDARRGTPLALGAAAGGILGKFIFQFATAAVVERYVTAVQSGLLLVLCLLVFVYTLKKKGIQRRDVQHIWQCVLLGLFLGTLSSFLGIGGGPINIMMISYFLSMDAKTTALHSIYTIFFSQIFSLGFTLISGAVPVVDGRVLLYMICGGISGALLGAGISRRMKNSQVDRVFLEVVCAIIGISLYNMLQALL